jgi:hypothetical protein
MASSDPLDIPAGVVPEDVDDLYARPLEEFTAARNELSKRLRADGERAAAAWVKGLAKPTAAAGAVNELARQEPQAIADLREAAAELSSLQEGLMKGTADRDRLRAAQQREREIIDNLERRATHLSPAATERVRETLHAAGVDERVGALVAAGRLTREEVAVGLGPMVAGGRETEPKPGPAKRSKPSAALGKKLERARRDQRDRRRELKRATTAAERARRALEKAEDQAQKAAAAMESAAAAQTDADARLAELEAEVAGEAS